MLAFFFGLIVGGAATYFYFYKIIEAGKQYLAKPEVVVQVPPDLPKDPAKKPRFKIKLP